MQGDSPRDRLEEARPAGAALELGVGTEPGCAGDGVDEDAGTVLIKVRAGEGLLGPLLEGDLPLSGGQQAGAEPLPEAILVAL